VQSLQRGYFRSARYCASAARIALTRAICCHIKGPRRLFPVEALLFVGFSLSDVGVLSSQFVSLPGVYAWVAAVRRIINLNHATELNEDTIEAIKQCLALDRGKLMAERERLQKRLGRENRIMHGGETARVAQLFHLGTRCVYGYWEKRESRSHSDHVGVQIVTS
jgi:hypothetical protein